MKSFLYNASKYFRVQLFAKHPLIGLNQLLHKAFTLALGCWQVENRGSVV